jgi:hypothetical protein
VANDLQAPASPTKVHSEFSPVHTQSPDEPGITDSTIVSECEHLAIIDSPNISGNVEIDNTNERNDKLESKISGENLEISQSDGEVASPDLPNIVVPQNVAIGDSNDRENSLGSSPVTNVAGTKNKTVSVVLRKKASQIEPSPQTSKSLPGMVTVVPHQEDQNTGEVNSQQADSPDISNESQSVQKRKMMFETAIANSSPISSLSKAKTVTVRPKCFPSPTKAQDSVIMSLAEEKIVAVRPKSLPPPVKGKIGTVGAASPQSPNGSGANVLQGKMVYVIPRKKTEATKTVSSPNASSALVVLQNGNLDKYSSKTNQGDRVVTVGRVSGSHAIDVPAEDMMRDESEMDYAIESVTVKGMSSTLCCKKKGSIILISTSVSLRVFYE